MVKLSTCGVCGIQIEDGDDYYSPENLISDYIFCSKPCVRTASIVDSIERLKQGTVQDVVDKIHKEFSNG